MLLYKLTDEKGQTKNNTQWGNNVKHRASGKSKVLCSDGFIHAYESPYLAVLLNPIHANFDKPKLWESKGIIKINDRGLKCGCKILTTIKEIPIPEVTVEIRIKFAILCSLEVYQKKDFIIWATNWLNTTDNKSAAAAHNATYAAAKAAHNAANATHTVAHAAANAANATYAAANAAAHAAHAAYYAANAAKAAAAYAAANAAAYNAANAAYYATYAATTINLKELARKAFEEK